MKMIHRLGRGEPEKGPRLIKDGGVWCGFVVFGDFLINTLFKFYSNQLFCLYYNFQYIILEM